MTQSTLNKPVLAAALLFGATALIHALVGGPEINAPVQASTLDPVVRAVSAVVWHALTALFLVLAVALVFAARDRNALLLWSVLALSAAFIVIFLGIGAIQLGNLTEMPQWILFAAISLCLGYGLKSA